MICDKLHACLTPIVVDNFAFLFNWMTVFKLV